MQFDNGLSPRPAHVPADLEVDFDFYRPDGLGDDVHAMWRRLHETGRSLLWTPRNGGHWVALKGADISGMQKDADLYSYRHVTIPANPTPALPLEVELERHAELRAVISPLLNPMVLKAAGARARDLSIELIEDLLPKGRCEFSADFARKLPIVVFLGLVDMPVEDREMLLALAEVRTRSPSAEAREEAKKTLLAYMQDAITTRRREPGEDFVSRIIHSDVGGAPIEDHDLRNLLSTIMFGGLDTVASMSGFIMRFLALNPGHRRQLVEDPDLIPRAITELIRRHGVSNTARVISRDAEHDGVLFKAGDRIQLPSCLVGLDDALFPDAMKVDFQRTNAGQHGAFGNGVHRCPGSNLARLELAIVIEEWLKRIPDFSIDPQDEVVVACGHVSGMMRLPLVWPV